MEEVRNVSERAGATASSAMEAVRSLQAKMDKEMQLIRSEARAQPDASKGGGKGRKKAEQRARSVKFNGYPKNTKSTEIKKNIN
eukprot:2921036-Karenia_brevis.AAC.1